MGSQVKEDCPFCAENARKRREALEATEIVEVTTTSNGPVAWVKPDNETQGG